MIAFESFVIQSLKGGPCMPKYYGYGCYKSFGVKFLITGLLGPSLEDLFEICNRRFSLKTCCMIMCQLINLMRKTHELNFIHRDIKPDNFLAGYGDDSNKIHLIDFGLAKKFRDNVSGHIPFSDKKHLTGTARFASLNSHRGMELSRRDDLEAIGNMVLYFALGSLPWQNI